MPKQTPKPKGAESVDTKHPVEADAATTVATEGAKTGKDQSTSNPIGAVLSHVDSMLSELDGMDISATEIHENRIVTPEQFDKVVADISKEYASDRVVAIAGVFCTLQAGGTSNNKRSNVKITIQGKGFESKKINASIIRHCKGITPRQFAKFFANQIFKCASKFGIIGNAYKYIKRHYPRLLTETAPNEPFWCSDFQIENDLCPEHIRGALRQRYADKFRRGLK